MGKKVTSLLLAAAASVTVMSMSPTAAQAATSRSAVPAATVVHQESLLGDGLLGGGYQNGGYRDGLGGLLDGLLGGHGRCGFIQQLLGNCYYQHWNSPR